MSMCYLHTYVLRCEMCSHTSRYTMLYRNAIHMREEWIAYMICKAKHTLPLTQFRATMFVNTCYSFKRRCVHLWVLSPGKCLPEKWWATFGKKENVWKCMRWPVIWWWSCMYLLNGKISKDIRYPEPDFIFTYFAVHKLTKYIGKYIRTSLIFSSTLDLIYKAFESSMLFM